MLYVERELNGEYPAEWQRIAAGNAVHTGPLLVHQTYFPVDTLLVSASKKPRDHVSHECDLVRIEEEWKAALR